MTSNKFACAQPDVLNVRRNFDTYVIKSVCARARACSQHSWDYPALTSALNLLDEVFDLQARSQWLRRGIINRLLGAPWVSHATNKKIIQATKAAIAPERIETIMSAIL